MTFPNRVDPYLARRFRQLYDSNIILNRWLGGFYVYRHYDSEGTWGIAYNMRSLFSTKEPAMLISRAHLFRLRLVVALYYPR